MSNGLPEGHTPVSYQVPVGDRTEVDLIRALDLLMDHFRGLEEMGDCMGRIRAADWVAAKYGSRR